MVRRDQQENDMILNLTQHTATAEQVAAGVVSSMYPSAVKALLDFQTLPSVADVWQRAVQLAKLAKASGCDRAMIGGAPFLMRELEFQLKAVGVSPLYAFSVRESVETTQPDGSVMKTAVFRHVGFYDPRLPKMEDDYSFEGE
jgi:hypothetical protein